MILNADIFNKRFNFLCSFNVPFRNINKNNRHPYTLNYATHTKQKKVYINIIIKTK